MTAPPPASTGFPAGVDNHRFLVGEHDGGRCRSREFGPGSGLGCRVVVMAPIPITRDLVDELTSQETTLSEQLARSIDRTADLRARLHQVQRALRRALRRLP